MPRPSPAERRARRATARPRRGTAAATRERLVTAAAVVFNRDGYHGTDSNRLARAAGYAPATFYKHFPDKRAIFLAVYEAWVTAEWTAIERVLRADATPATRAARIVSMVVALHRRWRGLRAGLRALVATDADARAFYRAQRRRQLRFIAHLGRRSGRPEAETGAAHAWTPAARTRAAQAANAAAPTHAPRGRSEDAAVLLFTLERVADAIADGELHDLDLALAPTLARLRALVMQLLESSPDRGRGRRSPARH